jgi:hypothetical protein
MSDFDEPMDVSDDALLDALRVALAGTVEVHQDTDRVPDAVVDGAVWVHDWVTADADLAELVNDSTGLHSAGLRGVASTRTFTFRSGDYECELEVTITADGAAVVGQLIPSATGTVTIQVAGRHHTTEIDEMGTFVLSQLGRGTAIGLVALREHSIRFPEFAI